MEKKSSLVIEIYKVIILTVIAVFLFLINSKLVTPIDAFSSIVNHSKQEIASNNSQANRDAVIADLTNLASISQQYFRKPIALGGGGNTFNSWTIPSSIVSTGNGEYSSNVSSESITLIGTGYEIGKDGSNKVKVTMVVVGDRIISTTINN